MEDEIWSLKQQISNMKAQYENNEQNLLNQVWRKAGFHFQIKIDISMETNHEPTGAGTMPFSWNGKYDKAFYTLQ